MCVCRIIGFHNTPYVTGRRVNVRTEILPHASLAVAKQITHNSSQFSSQLRRTVVPDNRGDNAKLAISYFCLSARE